MNTNNIKIQFWFPVIVSIIVCGCGTFREADQDARNTALIVKKRVIALKGQVRKKMGAERKYYRKAVKTLDDNMKNTTYVEIRKKPIKKALAEAESMHKKPDNVTLPMVAEKLATNAKDLVNDFEEGLQKQRVRREATEKTIRELKKLDQEYSALERTLVKLSIPPNKQDQIIRVGEFITEAVKHYKELEKARKKNE